MQKMKCTKMSDAESVYEVGRRGKCQYTLRAGSQKSGILSNKWSSV